MVFEASSIFIATAANEKKNTFCKNVYKPQVANKLNSMKTTGILWDFYQDMQNTSNKLFVDCKKMINVFFFSTNHLQN